MVDIVKQNIQPAGVFNDLKKIFSTAVFIRNPKTNKIHTVDVNRFQTLYNLETNRVIDKYEGIKRPNYGSFTVDQQSGVLQLRTQLYRSYEMMDTDSILSSVLDLYSDECLGPDTVIPLMNGTKITIKELHDLKEVNFEVYSLDNNYIDITSAICDGVKYNGKKEMYKIILNDESEILSTINHLWVSNNNLKYTSDLNIGDTIYSNSKHYIIDIQSAGLVDAYDLINTGESHVYAIETNDGSKLFCHNCTRDNEYGDILTITSPNETIKKSLHNLFYDVINIEFNLWSWVRNLPVKYDSYIPLLSGENIMIKDLSDRLKTGEDIWVYSVQNDTKQIVPGKVVWCDKNYTTNTIVKVTFDDDSYIETAPEHPFILRDGTSVRADELHIDDSLMPFYRKQDLLNRKKDNRSTYSLSEKTEYEKIYNPSTDSYSFTHRIVARSAGLNQYNNNKTTVHHVDFDRHNNIPTNLLHMNRDEHFQFHCEHYDTFTGLIRPNSTKKRLNHKVKDIKFMNENSDVYCMTVLGPNGEHDRHNFAICGKDVEGNPTINSGVFVENCKYGDFIVKLDLTERLGITGVYPLSVYGIYREENPDNPEDIRFRYDNNLGVKLPNYLITNVNGSLYENYEIAHFRLIADTNFLPYGRSILETARRVWNQLCLSGDTNIWTPTGDVQIKDIKPGDTVYAYEYDSNSLIETKVKNQLLTGKKDVYEIRTSHRSIKSTDEHPLMVSTGELKSVKDLTIDDKLLVSDLKNIISDNNLTYPNLFLHEKIVCKIKDEYKEEIKSKYSRYCWIDNKSHNVLSPRYIKKLFGITYSDYIQQYNVNKFQNGLLSGHGANIPYNDAVEICSRLNIPLTYLDCRVKHSNKSIIDEQILKDNFLLFVRFIGFMLGDGWLDKNSVCFSIGDRLDKSQKYIDFAHLLNTSCNKLKDVITSKDSCSIYSTYFRELLISLGFKTGTYNKEIPTWIYTLPYNYQLEFLLGFADADGTDYKDDTWQLGGMNGTLIVQLQQLSTRLGLTTSNISKYINTDNSIGYFGDIKNNSYTFTFSLNSNKLTYTDNLGRKFEKIRSIKLIGEVDVYDIEVTHDVHNFVANGLVAHNCMMEDAMLINRIMKAPERRIFKVDIGNIPSHEVDRHMEAIIQKMRKTPYVDENTGNYNLKFNLQPVRWDTLIPLIDGRTISIKRLSEECKSGIKNYVYSIDKDNGNKIVSGEVTDCILTLKDAELVRIVLDDDSYIDFEPRHPIMLRTGEYRLAKDMKPGDACMPFYTSKSKTKGLIDYELIYDPADDIYNYTHRIVADQYNIDDYKNTKNVIHHKNFIKDNNTPENLDCSMTFNEHINYHNKYQSDKWNNLSDEEKNKINQKRSLTHKQNFSSGKTKIWSTGLTKDTNSVLKENSKKISDSFTEERKIQYRERLTGVKKPEHSEFMKTKYVQYIRTNEIKNKISESLTGENNPNFNKTWEQIHGVAKSNEMKRELSQRSKIFLEQSNPMWNEKNKNDAKIRMVSENKRRWQDPDYKKKLSISMSHIYDDFIMNNIKSLIRCYKPNTNDELIKLMNNNSELLNHFLLLNSTKKISKHFTKYSFKKSLTRLGYKTISEFINSVLNADFTTNHKVKDVIFLTERDDVYCMEVKNYHNFAIDSHGGNIRNGIFVKNTMMEDFFLPVRGDKSGTTIETLPGMEWTGMEDIEYLKNRMLAALKIPKAFLNYEDTLHDKCIAPNTVIPLLNGKKLTVEEIATEFIDKDPDLWVYSYDTKLNKIIPTKIKYAKKTKIDTDLVRVHLDNGTYLDCTPDHKLIYKDGTDVEAQFLKEGDSLLAIKVASDELYADMYNVMNVETLLYTSDTYNLEVEHDCHNYLIESGIVIKNSTLSALEVRFASTIRRVQKMILSELNKMAIVHLALQGFKSHDLVNFDLGLTISSTIHEMEKVELWNQKVNLARDARDVKLLPDSWIYTNLFQFSEDEIKRIREELKEDVKFKGELAKLESEYGAMDNGFGGGFGGDMSGGFSGDFGSPDFGGTETYDQSGMESIGTEPEGNSTLGNMSDADIRSNFEVGGTEQIKEDTEIEKIKNDFLPKIDHRTLNRGLYRHNKPKRSFWGGSPLARTHDNISEGLLTESVNKEDLSNSEISVRLYQFLKQNNINNTTDLINNIDSLNFIDTKSKNEAYEYIKYITNNNVSTFMDENNLYDI